MGCPLRATPCCLEFDLSDEEEEGVVVVEEVVAPEDDVLTGRPTFSLRLDLQVQQQLVSEGTHTHTHTHARMHACTCTHTHTHTHTHNSLMVVKVLCFLLHHVHIDEVSIEPEVEHLISSPKPHVEELDLDSGTGVGRVNSAYVSVRLNFSYTLDA